MKVLHIFNELKYSGGEIMTEIACDIFLKNNPILCVRKLDCPRPSGFQKKMIEAIATSMSKSYQITPEYKEGFLIGFVLYKMGFIDESVISKLYPYHFSSETPFKKLKLDMYSKNIYL